MRRSFAGRCCPLLLAFFGISAISDARADLPMARLTSIFPMGAARGTTVDVVLTGSDLEGVDQLLFSQPGVSASLIEGLAFKVTVSADATGGLCDVRAVGTFGVSNPRTFVIDDLPQQNEVEPNNQPGEATPIPFNSATNGRLDARADVDYFSFEVPQGTRCVVDCFAERIDSRLTGVLTLFSPNGRRIGVSRAYVGKDPRIDFVAQQAGKYSVRITDLTYDGSAEYFYRLAVHSGPVVDHAYPPVVRPGATETVTLFGRNLPGGKLRAPMEDPMQSKRRGSTLEPLESLEISVVAPTDTGVVSGLATDFMLRPTQASIDGFAHYLPITDRVSIPVLLGFTEQNVVMEVEPNQPDSSAQVIQVPAEIVGRCDPIGDEDWYRFSAKKDQILTFEGISERAGFPADLTFLLRRVLPEDPNQPGKFRAEDIGEYDDNPANVGRFLFDSSTHDPLTVYQVPADGDYLLGVRDRFGNSRGDERFVYRVWIGTSRPDFRLAVTPPDEANISSLLVRQGGTSFLRVFALRRGGFSGEIKVEATGLPPGLTAPPVILGPNVTEVPLVFTAAADMPDFTGPIEIQGTADIGGMPVVHLARASTIVWPGSGSAPTHSRLSRGFVAAVRANAPYLLTATPQQAHFGQGSQFSLNLQLQRRWPEFTGKIEGIAALSPPANVDQTPVVIGDNGTEGVLHLFFKREVPPGSYSFAVRGTAQVPYGKNPEDKKANVPVLDPSLPVTVTVLPRPVELTANPKTPSVKVGGEVAIPVTVNRVNDFSGPVDLELTVPPGLAGISAAKITVPAEEKVGTIKIVVAADVPVGDKSNVTVRGTAKVGEQDVTVDDLIVLKVTQ